MAQLLNPQGLTASQMREYDAMQMAKAKEVKTPNPGEITPISTPVSSVLTPAPKPVTDTSAYAREVNDLKAKVAAMSAVKTPEQSVLDYQNAYNQAGTLTPQEEEMAKSQVSAQYDPLIAKAKKDKLAGYGSSVVGAGERGGFMNTQFAGIGAIVPGVEDRAGTGGKLAQIKSEYDYNIQQLEVAKQNAITQAKQAISTGKKADYEKARALYQNAQDIAMKQQQLTEQSKLNALSAQKTSLENKSKEFDIIKEEVTPDITNRINAGEDPQTIIDDYTSKGYDINTINSALISYQQDKQKESLLNTEKSQQILNTQASILAKTKKGGKINIPGVGDVEIVGVGEENKAPTTLKAGGKVYNYAGGKWVDTGIKDTEFTFENQIQALLSLGSLIKAGDLSPELQAVSEKIAGSLGVNIPSKDKIITSPSGISYDLSTYATDPSHAINIQNIMSNMGKLSNVSDIDNYIKNTPNSPITADMITSASSKYGVGWEELTALLKQESNLGTAGTGAKTFNPGNVGNTDSGATKNMGSWQSGVDAAAQQLARRKTTAKKGDDFGKFTSEQIALNTLPVQTRNSDTELKRALGGIQAGLSQGKTPFEVADEVMGFVVNKPDELSKNVRSFISQNEKVEPSAPAEFARLLNKGDNKAVINKLESIALKGTDVKEKYEPLARYMTEYGDKAINSINSQLNNLGIVAGNWNKLSKKFKSSPEFQSLAANLAGLTAEWRKNLVGTAATENELKFIQELVPTVSDNPFNAIKKIEELQNSNFSILNSKRQTYNLPPIDKNTLDLENRASLYGAGKSQPQEITKGGKTYVLQPNGKYKLK